MGIIFCCCKNKNDEKKEKEEYIYLTNDNKRNLEEVYQIRADSNRITPIKPRNRIKRDNYY